jgi:hypothetical protein
MMDCSKWFRVIVITQIVTAHAGTANHERSRSQNGSGCPPPFCMTYTCRYTGPARKEGLNGSSQVLCLTKSGHLFPSYRVNADGPTAGNLSCTAYRFF